MTAGSGNRSLGLMLVIAAAVLWGSTGTVQALLPPAREPIVVAAVRLAIAALTLLALAGCAARSRAGFRDLNWRGVAAAGVAIAAYNVMFFIAVTGAGIGIGTALAIGSAPIWVTLYEIVVLRRLPGGMRLLGQGVCILGAVLLVVSGSAANASLGGIVLALLAGSAYAIYAVITGRIGQSAPPATLAAATFSVAALVLAPALLILPTDWLAMPGAMEKLAFLGVFATGLAYALYTWGLRHVSASTGVTLSLVEPLTAWLLATFLIGEPSSSTKILGAALLFLGLVMVTRTPADQGARRLTTE